MEEARQETAAGTYNVLDKTLVLAREVGAAPLLTWLAV